MTVFTVFATTRARLGLGRIFPFLALALVAACGSAPPQSTDMPAAASPLGAPGSKGFAERLVWALNVGGPAVRSRAGEDFTADDCRQGAGACAAVAAVGRTQNDLLYQTYRRGDQRYAIDVPVGAYDVVLYFAEPSREAGLERLFDVDLEGVTVLDDFSVWHATGMEGAAVTRSFPSVSVEDGVLDIALTSRVGDALLSAVLVRQATFATQGWVQVWSDEFAGDQLSPDNWAIEVWPARVVNDEDQEYTADRRNVRVEDGRLILEAHYQGPDEPAYSSGRVHSSGLRDLQYGRVDIRARVPEGRGVWPALWFLPTDPYRYATNCGPSAAEWQGNDECNAWPNSGEIDLMEHVGNEPGVVHGTVHTRDYYGGLGTQIGEAVVLNDLGTAFHTYSLVWEAGALAMYVDGHRYFSYFEDDTGVGQWPFDHPFHVILNLAVGGYWGRAGGPVDREAFPQRLEVDYVRIYAPELPDSAPQAAVGQTVRMP